uniref:Uncharacterized protein n=1 Tax=Arundo donax TaxID=35708 RepID=A0A0A9FLV6_ARUDO
MLPTRINIAFILSIHVTLGN